MPSCNTNSTENNPAIAILTDDDKAGNKSAGAIINEIKGLDVYFERVKLPDKLDANEWLCKDSKRLEDFIKETTALIKIKSTFQRNSRGNILATADNFKNIFKNDPKLKDCAAYNAFSAKIVRNRHDLPWDHQDFQHPIWDDSDDKAIQNYIEHTYENLRSSPIYQNAA